MEINLFIEKGKSAFYKLGRNKKTQKTFLQSLGFFNELFFSYSLFNSLLHISSDKLTM